MDSRPFPRFGLQLERGLEEVDVETGNLVESTQCRCFTQTLQAAITNQLANNGSVLLFDPRLIVLSIGAAASENDALLLAIIQQRVVHECAVVVCVQSEQRKGKLGPQTSNGFYNEALLANRKSQALGPSRGHVGQYQRVHKAAH